MPKVGGVNISLAVWNDTTPYIAGNIVLDRGAIWQAVDANTNSQPSPTNSHWVLVSGKPDYGLALYSLAEMNLSWYNTMSPFLYEIFESMSFSTEPASLTIMEFPLLVVIGKEFCPSDMASLTSMEFPLLAAVGESFDPYTMASLTSMEFPLLVAVGGYFRPSDMASLETMSFPLLIMIVGYFYPSDMASLTSMEFPLLAVVGGYFYPYNMASLVSMDFPLLSTIGEYLTLDTDVASLTTFTLPSLLSLGGDVTITSPSLNITSVNALLVRLAALDGTGGTTTYDSHAIDMSGNCAAPGATGLAAIAILIARSNTVKVNFGINALNQVGKTFTVDGDASGIGATLDVAGSTGNDGTYTKVSAIYNSPNTVITVEEAIPSAVVDGWVKS